MNQPTTKTNVWKKRIDKARQRRDELVPTWEYFAQLYTHRFLLKKQINEDALVDLPNGDRISVGAIFRAIEQSRALLHVSEVGVRAELVSIDRELGPEDTHREAIVEQGLNLSMARSGFLKETKQLDYETFDCMICGHAVNFTEWHMVEEEVEGEGIAVMEEDETGAFVPRLGDDGLPVFDYPKETVTVWEGTRDVRISPLKFLFAYESDTIRGARWHGHEDIVRLDTLKKNPLYNIPGDIKGASFQTQDLYGKRDNAKDTLDDSVRIINIYDKETREFIVFLETTPDNLDSKKKKNKPTEKSLIPIRVSKHPVRFTHPEQSPYCDLVLIPASDHPFSVTHIEHIRNPSNEVDKLRTRAANLTRMLKTILLFQQGRGVDEKTMQTAINRPESTPVFVKLEEGETWDDIYQKIDLGSLHPEILQQIQMGEESIRSIMGEAEVPFGGAETATESENQMAIGGARPRRKQDFLFEFIATVASRHKDFLRRFARDAQNMMFIADDGTEIFQVYGREAFEGDYLITATAGGGATNVSPVKRKALAEVFNMTAGRYGPTFDLLMLRENLVGLDVRNVNALMKAARQGLGSMAEVVPAPGGVNRGQGGELFNPNDQTNGQAIRAAVNAPNEGGLTT